MARVLGGPRSWKGERDENGFRTWTVVYLVGAEATESPMAVMDASGLPTIGTPCSLTGYTGSDAWSWCRPERRVTIHDEQEGDWATVYRVECVFSNRFDEPTWRCWDVEIQNPLMEPWKISGTYTNVQWEARYDRNGYRAITSAKEPIVGQNLSFEYTRPTVVLQQNVGNLDLAGISSMVNTVNDRAMWGVPARCIKLSGLTWERKTMGRCVYYYTRTFTFEVDNYNHDKDGNLIGFDREIWDSGSLVLKGHWYPDPTHPTLGGSYVLESSVNETSPSTINAMSMTEFIAYKDMNYENTRVFLDGKGRPEKTTLSRDGAVIGTSDAAATWRFEFYRESNFLTLGIPANL